MCDRVSAYDYVPCVLVRVRGVCVLVMGRRSRRGSSVFCLTRVVQWWAVYHPLSCGMCRVRACNV